MIKRCDIQVKKLSAKEIEKWCKKKSTDDAKKTDSNNNKRKLEKEKEKLKKQKLSSKKSENNNPVFNPTTGSSTFALSGFKIPKLRTNESSQGDTLTTQPTASSSRPTQPAPNREFNLSEEIFGDNKEKKAKKNKKDKKDKK